MRQVRHILNSTTVEKFRFSDENCVCGTGLLYSAAKLNLETDDINSNVVNVRSEADAVSAMDRQGGWIQTIKCFGAKTDWLGCHAVVNQAAELQSACNYANKTIWTTYS